MTTAAHAQTGGTRRARGPATGVASGLPPKLPPRLPTQQSCQAGKGFDPWSSLPSWPLSAESSNFQRLGLSYPIWDMGLAGLAPRLRSIAASFIRVQEVIQGRIQNPSNPKEVLNTSSPLQVPY